MEQIAAFALLVLWPNKHTCLCFQTNLASSGGLLQVMSTYGRIGTYSPFFQKPDLSKQSKDFWIIESNDQEYSYWTK